MFPERRIESPQGTPHHMHYQYELMLDQNLKAMKNVKQSQYTTRSGYMTERVRTKYISMAMDKQLLPNNAHRMSDVLSLTASADLGKPIQFWQLYSVLGQERIVRILQNFYGRVFADETWFSSVFSRIAGIEYHVNSQASMWIDVMGGGQYYHGGEYRLNFHHSHNAMELMNDKGAKRWCELMRQTLDDPSLDLTTDTRVRISLNTFLSYFMSKYADEFNFKETGYFGKTNTALKRRINLMTLSSDEIEALEEHELQEVLVARGADLSLYPNKAALVSKVLSL